MARQCDEDRFIHPSLSNKYINTLYVKFLHATILFSSCNLVPQRVKVPEKFRADLFLNFLLKFFKIL